MLFPDRKNQHSTLGGSAVIIVVIRSVWGKDFNCIDWALCKALRLMMLNNNYTQCAFLVSGTNSTEKRNLLYFQVTNDLPIILVFLQTFENLVPMSLTSNHSVRLFLLTAFKRIHKIQFLGVTKDHELIKQKYLTFKSE